MCDEDGNIEKSGGLEIRMIKVLVSRTFACN